MSLAHVPRVGFVLMIIIASVLLAAGPAPAKAAMRLAATTHPDHIYTQTAFRFAEIVAQKTNGEITIKVYPNRQLGNEREQMEMVGLGTIELALPPVGLVSNMAPELAALQLPFLYDNATVLSKALQLPMMSKVKETLEPSGLKCLCVGSSGLRLLMLKDRTVTNIDEMKGLKLRTLQAPVYMETVKAVGASPTPLPYGEVYTALQQGVIDGAFFDIGAVLLFNFAKIAESYTRVGYMDLPFTIVINKGIFDKLPPETQKILLEAADEALQFNISQLQDFDQTADQKLSALGCRVHKVKDLKVWKERVRPIWDEYAKKYPLAAEYITECQKLNEEFGEK